MKKLIIFIAIFMTCMITNSCLWPFDEDYDFFDTEYYIINNSSDTIYIAQGNADDSTIINNCILSHLSEMAPNDSDLQEDNSNGLKKYFLQVDIWKKSTIKKYTRDYIREHDIVDKRYILNYYDLEKMNFRIVYE